MASPTTATSTHPPQLDLLAPLGRATARLTAELASARRTVLGAGAWIDYLPGWVDGHQTLHDALREDVQWRVDRRVMYEREIETPRLLARFPRDGLLPAVLAEAGERLGAHYGIALDGVSAAFYRDGRDGVAMHGDRVGRDVTETIVAIVSLGAPRRFLLKPVAGGPSLRLSPGEGDLLVMGGTCQRTWLHGIPKVRTAGARISVQYRMDGPGKSP
ncbi:MAG: alpha-ketoglutarate-dependent dioxygenase AlkB [Ectothiorhodospiraceae bacterium]|nr:alpha-ketoglutarate-dependent dioxygenase AlkB [Ectothiorhodospiraceae bacterium]